MRFLARKRIVYNAASPTRIQQNSKPGTALKIPYGNKEVALKLGGSYVSDELAEWLNDNGMDHVRGAL